ncbi:uncharacterized protein At4g04775-like [Mercurialis annua]|uniref:uncharacterized protein At4g04775-like n=1 Tax=Mercurialis annua TaxID=3986 RepID=UPI002160B132|nr:uncharacterized protein At4g04775-like [Mercurialis annua]
MSEARGIETKNQEEYAAPFPVYDVPKCKCGIDAKVMVAWTEKNPGRRFFRCPNWRAKQCSFFSWYDEEYAPHIKHMLNSLKKQKEALQKEGEVIKGDLFYQKFLNDRCTVLDSIAMETEIVELKGNTLKMIEFEKENKKLKYEKAVLKYSLIAVVVLSLAVLFVF